MGMKPHLMRQKTPPGDCGPPHNSALGLPYTLVCGKIAALYDGTQVHLNVGLALC